jgi:glutathione peroxidase
MEHTAHCGGLLERFGGTGSDNFDGRIRYDQEHIWEDPLRKLASILVLCVAGICMASSAKSVYDFTLKSIDGQPVSLSVYRGKVLLLVNVASKCGYTPQYAGLESLYEKYKDRGLVIVGIPANNFAGQEPGTNAEIKKFCSNRYNVSFPMMSKVSVLGADETPLYVFLTDKTIHPQIGGDIKWNFTKFLFDRNGKPTARFEPAVTPDSPQVIAAIESALGR